MGLGPWHLLLIAVVVLLLFGNRLPQVMRSLGEGVVEFKKGMQGIEEDKDRAAAQRKAGIRFKGGDRVFIKVKGICSMWGLGPSHIAVLGVIAVLLFGDRLPEVMRSLGRGMVEFKKGLRGIETAIDSASTASAQRFHADLHRSRRARRNNRPTLPTAAG